MKTTFLALAIYLALGVLIDAYLYFTGQPTISDMLRAANKCWTGTSLVAGIFLAYIFWHLFLERR